MGRRDVGRIVGELSAVGPEFRIEMGFVGGRLRREWVRLHGIRNTAAGSGVVSAGLGGNHFNGDVGGVLYTGFGSTQDAESTVFGMKKISKRDRWRRCWHCDERHHPHTRCDERQFEWFGGWVRVSRGYKVKKRERERERNDGVGPFRGKRIVFED